MANPRAERQLILLSAGTAARRLATREQARQLIAEVDPEQLAATLLMRKLLPVLGPRIVEIDDERLHDGFSAEVDQALESGRLQSSYLQLICMRVMSMLADAGIRAAPLKGPFLSEAIYADAGRRFSSDIDLLVSPDQLHAAVDVVRELGYAAPTDHVDASGLPLLHLVLTHARGELPPVELHWRVHWYERRFAAERLLPTDISLPGAWRPPPVAELTALLLFYARDGFIDLRLASDLGAWWDACGDGVQLGELDELVLTYPELARVVPAALLVAGRTVGLPAPRIMRSPSPLGVRQRVAARLANPNPHSSESQVYADMGLIDGLLAPPGGLGAFVRRQLLPPLDVLDEQARHGSKRRPRSPAARCIGMLARYGLTMSRVFSGGEA
jgi:Uncharacterised nucleotidyltransferase